MTVHYQLTIDRVESAVLFSLIGGGLIVCALGASVYDFGRLFSILVNIDRVVVRDLIRGAAYNCP